jgi:UDP-4-amino-4,6-dideoxy-N-acetyl-beta-L-altrosamine N-acetyltransferase
VSGMNQAEVKFVGLRALDDGMISQIRAWRNAPHVKLCMCHQAHIEEAEHEAYIRAVKDDPNRALFVYYVNGAAKGVLQYEFFPSSNHVTMGYYLKDECDLAGSYGAFAKYFFIEYAFRRMNVHKVFGEVLARNTKVVALHRGFGYKQEGLLRDQVLLGGAYEDVCVFGLLREEWLGASEGAPSASEKIGRAVGRFVKMAPVEEIFVD